MLIGSWRWQLSENRLQGVSWFAHLYVNLGAKQAESERERQRQRERERERERERAMWRRDSLCNRACIVGRSAFYTFIVFVYLASSSSQVTFQQRIDRYSGDGKQFKVKVKILWLWTLLKTNYCEYVDKKCPWLLHLILKLVGSEDVIRTGDDYKLTQEEMRHLKVFSKSNAYTQQYRLNVYM